MGTDQALGFLNGMLWNALIIAAPILLATLLVGLAISILQVATQIQEITLSYVPKIAMAAFMLILLGPWMSATIATYARTLYLSIPDLAGL
ncbi:MAG: flagellar biosynthetic protein FliQ [Blastomonas sp.]